MSGRMEMSRFLRGVLDSITITMREFFDVGLFFFFLKDKQLGIN